VSTVSDLDSQLSSVPFIEWHEITCDNFVVYKSLTDLMNLMPRNKNVVENFQRLSDTYQLEDMTESEQNIFILEFLRVLQLRYKTRLDLLVTLDPNNEKIYEEEILKLTNELINKYHD
jgi:hypothetical protein